MASGLGSASADHYCLPMFGLRMNRRAAATIVATALCASLFAAVTTSSQVHLGEWPAWTYAPSDREPIDLDAEPLVQAQPLVQESDSEPAETPGWLETLLGVVFYALGLAVAAFIIAKAIAAWRERPPLRWRRRQSSDPTFDALPNVAAAIVEEAEAQRAALLTGEPRNAIVRCWLRLEHDVAAAGLTRNPAHTSVEFTEHVLSEYSVDNNAIRELAALYREARFSRHPLEESSRLAALDALDQLHRALSHGARESSIGSSH